MESLVCDNYLWNTKYNRNIKKKTKFMIEIKESDI